MLACWEALFVCVCVCDHSYAFCEGLVLSKGAVQSHLLSSGHQAGIHKTRSWSCFHQ